MQDEPLTHRSSAILVSRMKGPLVEELAVERCDEQKKMRIYLHDHDDAAKRSYCTRTLCVYVGVMDESIRVLYFLYMYTCMYTILI
jgi:hypothetical protein